MLIGGDNWFKIEKLPKNEKEWIIEKLEDVPQFIKALKSHYKK